MHLSCIPTLIYCKSISPMIYCLRPKHQNKEDLSMFAFICYFFPSVISLRIFESLTKTCLTLKQCIFRFCTNAFFVNFTCVAIKKFVLHTANEPLTSTSLDMLPSVAFNYMIMAFGISVILVVAEVLLSKNIKITVEEPNDETNQKKK